MRLRKKEIKMKTEREFFEKLPEIRKIMNENGIYFMNHSGWYEASDFKDFEHEQYINGAWYAFQEQQKKIDGALKELELLNYYRTGNSDNAIKILKGIDK